MSILIAKARISAEHHVLEIGFGWGSLAVEVVKQTGCKYTGITLSEQQLEYAQLRVEQAGLQDQITLLLCDYRQMPNKAKYDRIIVCEVLEHVGHEFIGEFFTSCESALAEDGLLVLQVISMPDPMYDEYIHSGGFIKEYIFPGGCLPALSRLISAMAAASRLCVVHLEEIGIHYYQTLRCWRKNFLKNKSQIHALGFDDKFIRTWEYYFDYCAAGFKTCTLGDYQIVFSRPGNVATFGDPYIVVNMKVAVVGAGISGVISAYELAKAGVEVVVYEKENYLGGHANTVTVDGSILTLVLWSSIGHRLWTWPEVKLQPNKRVNFLWDSVMVLDKFCGVNPEGWISRAD
ncbi:hypothetical protein CQW23_22725 [Capsicum baccatum]|uniref:Tuberculostearic acid methyltransferase UfaA1 n=1 Tax=Capsicum baccatum TaxID=33114 RepID=A0A2G2W1P9_CAPBA|nr:hypothetical protein CQW23_22725 [Capsicum baccatum]